MIISILYVNERFLHITELVWFGSIQYNGDLQSLNHNRHIDIQIWTRAAFSISIASSPFRFKNRNIRYMVMTAKIILFRRKRMNSRWYCVNANRWVIFLCLRNRSNDVQREASLERRLLSSASWLSGNAAEDASLRTRSTVTTPNWLCFNFQMTSLYIQDGIRSKWSAPPLSLLTLPAFTG